MPTDEKTSTNKVAFFRVKRREPSGEVNCTVVESGIVKDKFPFPEGWSKTEDQQWKELISTAWGSGSYRIQWITANGKAAGVRSLVLDDPAHPPKPVDLRPPKPIEPEPAAPSAAPPIDVGALLAANAGMSPASTIQTMFALMEHAERRAEGKLARDREELQRIHEFRMRELDLRIQEERGRAEMAIRAEQTRGDMIVRLLTENHARAQETQATLLETALQQASGEEPNIWHDALRNIVAGLDGEKVGAVLGALTAAKSGKPEA